MLPIQLTLKNFLSYQEATLDFRGLHVACICGANGAGKSSLLEAIAWAVWGESRASTEDDVIHVGAIEASVDFSFQSQQQTYRIIRSRHRGQISSLEFQVQTPQGFRSLTERGVRATQQLILQHLKLDYDTFINSAYLRQGRADEFMLKRPSERKQILADLLKLDRYDLLSEQAKEQSRQLKAELTLLERNLEQIKVQLQQEPILAAEQAQLRIGLEQQQQQQDADQTQRQQLQTLQNQRQQWLQQLDLQQQSQRQFNQDCDRLRQDLEALEHQMQALELILQATDTIVQDYTQLQQLETEEEIQTQQFQTYQALRTKRHELQQHYSEQAQALKERLRQAQTHLQWLQNQQRETQQTLTTVEEVEYGMQQLRQSRSRLTELDQIQMQVAPLLQRRQQLQSQIDRQHARLTARLEELQTVRQQLEAQQQTQTQIEQSVIAITDRIEQLKQRRLYQHQVREKGMERRTFMERLQEQQRKCERELAELDHKLLLLYEEAGWEQAEAWTEAGVGSVEKEAQRLPGTASVLSPESPAYPPCPLCHRPLDQHHWQIVLQQHQQEKQEIQNQLWVIREQLTTSDREIRVLRQEYRDVDKELSDYGAVLEHRGQLQNQLQGILQNQQRLQQVIVEQIELERSLEQGDYAAEIYSELQLLDQSLQQLNYDDRDHALVRGQVDRWRWAEIKQVEIRQAQRKHTQLLEQQPPIATEISALQQQLADLNTSPLHQAIEQINQQLLQLNYSPDQHNALRQRLRQAQPSQLRYQALQQAQQQSPVLQQRWQELVALWNDRQQLKAKIELQIADLEQQLTQTPDLTNQIQALETQIQVQRSQLDQQLAQFGRLQQRQQQLAEMRQQQDSITAQIQTLRHSLRVYQELAQAFGKNGIQALMIENVLPQLEAETNHILGRLSANQLHVQFVTQRASRKSATTKLIDTLDILISDVQGTRPYETYSGGEAFRVNFAIRLALARLLAQRSGLTLQLLIIDEGFGTQDEAGCDRLIGAINAIAADFACILTVTHIPHLKEAFQTRIEVAKTDRGSQVKILT